MWGGQLPANGGMGSIYGGGGMSQLQQSQTAASSNQKNDIFVGNLAFNTTEEQLYAAFSEIGRVVNVRMVTDQETGKMRGFAFVEYEDPQAALSAIRNMNEYELNGRRLRVNFSNSSHLEALAGKLGMDLTQGKQQQSKTSTTGGAGATSSGTNAVADALKGMSKGEMYDVVAKLKEIADRDPDEARRVIAGHPQLPEALLFCMSKLDMVKTPLSSTASTAAAAATTTAPVAENAVPITTTAAVAPAVPQRVADPRATTVAAAPAAPAAPRTDPRARVDPRAAIAASKRSDPRAAGAARVPPPPPPPVQQPPMSQPTSYMPQQQPPPPPPMQHNVAGLDPSLVQQVMSLTPQQIQQLPPDKQQSILQLRQQITGGL